MTRFLAGSSLLLTALTLAREVSVAFGGNETTLALALAVWAAASLVGLRRRRHPDDPARLGRADPGAVAAWVIATPVLLVLARGLDPLLSSWIPGDPQLGRLLLGAVLVLAPAGVIGTMALPAAVNAHAADAATGPAHLPRRPGGLAGAAAGGLTASLLTTLGQPTTLAIALATAAAAGMLLAAPPAPAGRQTRPGPGGRAAARTAVGALGLVLAAALALLSHPADRVLTRWTHPRLALTAETARGRLVVDRRGEDLVVFRDGARLQTSRETGGAELVHLAATQRDRTGRVLVLGGWLQDLAGELAAYRPDTVIALEPDPARVRLLGRLSHDLAPPHAVQLADPRAWLAAGSDRFDLIVSSLPDPVTVGAERHWTEQFFARCAARLRAGGVLAASLRTPDEVWTPRQARRVAAVHQALQQSFPHVRVLPGIATVVLAAPRPLDDDAVRMAARLATGPGTPDLISPQWLRWRWQGDRTDLARQLLAQSAVAPSSDLRPVSTGDALLRDLGRLLPGLGWHATPRPGQWLGPLIIVVAALLLFLRRRRQAALAAVTGFAGLAAAMLAVVLLMHHQVQHGTLARDLGGLFALLAAGRGLGPWLLPRQPGPVGRWRMPGLLVALSLGSFLTTLGLFGQLALLSEALLLLGAGALTGAISLAAGRCPGAPRWPLLACEVGGAALGAVLAALLLVPFSGLPATALTVAALAFPAAVAIWPLPGRPGPTAP